MITAAQSRPQPGSRPRRGNPLERTGRPLRFYILPAAALFVFIRVFPLLAPILFSLLLILLISLAVEPTVFKLRALTGRRAIAAGLVATAFVVLMFFVGLAFFRPVKSSAGKFADRFPAYWERFQKPLIKLEQQVGLSEEKLQAEVATEAERKNAVASSIDDEPEKRPRTTDAKSSAPANSIRSSVGQALQSTAGQFTTLAFNAVQIGVVLVTVFFGVTFTLMNPRPVFGAILSVIPEPHHEQATMILHRIGTFMPRWALSTLLAMVIVGSLVFLLMWPLFGFVDAVVLGLIAGVFEAIPYLGPILSAVPAILLALGEGGTTPLWVIGIYLGVQFLENNLISPLVMAGGLKLHPVAVMISMLLCVTAFGVLGLIAAAPLVAIVHILHEELYRKRFLPGVTDADLDRMTRKILGEPRAADS
jgi:predicted PurR-regulated permease PerM